MQFKIFSQGNERKKELEKKELEKKELEKKAGQAPKSVKKVVATPYRGSFRPELKLCRRASEGSMASAVSASDASMRDFLWHSHLPHDFTNPPL